MSKLENAILDRINKNKYGAFTSSDFLCLGKYKAISKALETMDDNKIIKRIIRGVYYVPYFDKELNIFSLPKIDDIANALARQYNWNIVPSGNYALNLIGISTQVPSQYVYVIDGPYREYQVGKISLKFKHTTSKEVNGLPIHVLIAIQAMKKIGKDNLDDLMREKIHSYLTNEDYEVLKSNNYKITSWIYDELLMGE